jgi:GT2 family glycosyltransferase
MPMTLVPVDPRQQNDAHTSAPTWDELTVLVLTYGRSDRHRALLDDLFQQGIAPEQVMLVHNPDGSRQGARPSPAPPLVSVLSMHRNRGWGPAMNAGLQLCLERKNRWLLLLSNDARFPPGSLSELLRAAGKPHEYGVLGPSLVHADGRPFSYGGIDMRSNIVGHRTVAPPTDQHGIAECKWVDGGVWLIKVDALKRVGLFEERFWMYFEEAEFCSRVRKAGWKVGVAMSSVVETSPGRTKRPAAYGFLYCRNGMEFAWQDGGTRRLASAVVSQIRMAWWLAPRPYNRRFFDAEFRRTGYATVRGMALGAVAFALRRFGPPPPRVRKASDIRNTG